VNRAKTDDAAASRGDEDYENLSEVLAANSSAQHHYHHHHHHYHCYENHQPQSQQQSASAAVTAAGDVDKTAGAGATHHTAAQSPSVNYSSSATVS